MFLRETLIFGRNDAKNAEIVPKSRKFFLAPVSQQPASHATGLEQIHFTARRINHITLLRLSVSVWSAPRCSVLRPWVRAGRKPLTATLPGPATLTTSHWPVFRRRRGRGGSWPPHSSCLLSPSSGSLQDPLVACSRRPSILSTAIWSRIFSKPFMLSFFSCFKFMSSLISDGIDSWCHLMLAFFALMTC